MLIHFVVEKMPILRAINANLNRAEVMKKLGEWWRSLNDVERDKPSKQLRSLILNGFQPWRFKQRKQLRVMSQTSLLLTKFK